MVTNWYSSDARQDTAGRGSANRDFNLRDGGRTLSPSSISVWHTARVKLFVVPKGSAVRAKYWDIPC
jgi:hypothetical protein